MHHAAPGLAALGSDARLTVALTSEEGAADGAEGAADGAAMQAADGVVLGSTAGGGCALGCAARSWPALWMGAEHHAAPGLAALGSGRLAPASVLDEGSAAAAAAATAAGGAEPPRKLPALWTEHAHAGWTEFGLPALGNFRLIGRVAVASARASGAITDKSNCNLLLKR